MNNVDNAILYFANPMYKPKPKMHIGLKEHEWDELFKKIFMNNVDMLVLSRIYSSSNEAFLFKAKNLCALQQSKVDKTLRLLISLMNLTKVKLLLFKSFSPFPQYKDDIDVYVESYDDFQLIKHQLEKRDFNETHVFEKECHYDKDGYVQIDLHWNISWDFLGRGGAGPKLFDLAEMWKRKQNFRYKSFNFFTPAIEDELLILCAHSLFQHSYLTLGEIIYIGELIRLNRVNFEYLLKTSSVYGWELELQRCLASVAACYLDFWGIKLKLPFIKKLVSSENAGFPVYFRIPAFVSCGHNNFRNVTKKVVRFLVYTYRYIYYFHYQRRLCFNKIPNELESLGKITC